ncbi:MAG: DUF1214 domain-containing protein [Planctomycetia bacterium]|nr:DUF1214 domain-containing protein [Planctomycetia bacterium]
MKRILLKKKRWSLLILTSVAVLICSTAPFVVKCEENKDNPSTSNQKKEETSSLTNQASSKSNSVPQSKKTPIQTTLSASSKATTEPSEAALKQAIVSPENAKPQTQTVLRPNIAKQDTETKPQNGVKGLTNDPFVDSAEKELFQIMTDAYIYAFPLVLMNEIEKEMTDSIFFAPVNQMAYIPKLPSPSFKMTECPNSDALTSIAWLDLSQGPQVICLPKTSSHSFILELLDAWTNVLETFSNDKLDQFPIRELDGRQIRCFIIADSNFNDKEAEGIPVIKSSSNMTWLINRVLLGSPRRSRESAIAAASRVLYEFEIIPLNLFLKEFQKSTEKTTDSSLSLHFPTLKANQIVTAPTNPKFAKTFSLLNPTDVTNESSNKKTETRLKTSQNSLPLNILSYNNKVDQDEQSAKNNTEQNKQAAQASQTNQNALNDQNSQQPNSGQNKQNGQNNNLWQNKQATQASQTDQNALNTQNNQQTNSGQNKQNGQNNNLWQNKQATQASQTNQNALNTQNNQQTNSEQNKQNDQNINTEQKGQNSQSSQPNQSDPNIPIKTEPELLEEESLDFSLNQTPETLQNNNKQNIEDENSSEQINHETQKELDSVENNTQQSIQNDLDSDDEIDIEAEEINELDRPENNSSKAQYLPQQSIVQKTLFSYKKRPLKRKMIFYRNVSSRADNNDSMTFSFDLTETIIDPQIISNSTSDHSETKASTKSIIRISNDSSQEPEKLENEVDRIQRDIEKETQKEEIRLEKMVDHAKKTADRIGDDIYEMSDRLYDRTKSLAKDGIEFGKESINYFDRKAKRDYQRLMHKIGMLLEAEKWVEHPVDRVKKMTTTEFFVEFAELLKKNPPLAEDKDMIAKLAKIGIVPGESFDPTKLDSKSQKLLQYIAPYAQGKIQEAAFYGLCRKTLDNYWIIFTDLGQYGTDYMRRAVIATEFIGADSAQYVLYPYTMVDQDGNFLNGKNDYVLHFPAGQTPPVRALWSLSMYDKNHYLVPNHLKRYAIRSNEPLVYNEDGSLDLYIQHNEPLDKVSNWLPAPKDEFMLMLRLYLPKENALDGNWKIAPVQMIKDEKNKENK